MLYAIASLETGFFNTLLCCDTTQPPQISPEPHYLGNCLVVVSPGELLVATKTAIQEILKTEVDQMNSTWTVDCQCFGAFDVFMDLTEAG